MDAEAMTLLDGCTHVNESIGLHFLFIVMVLIASSRRCTTTQNVKDALVRIISKKPKTRGFGWSFNGMRKVGV